jgi:hypothetical protein
LRQPKKFPDNHPLSLSLINLVRRQLSDFIFVGLDKNSGKTAILCPVKMHRILTEVFYDDRTHYVDLTNQIHPKSVLNAWQKAYYVYKWTSVARLRKFGSLPYAYATPKNKDLTRYRSIISYANHPLKLVYGVAQRAIIFMIKSINVTHFTLHKTHDVLRSIQKIQSDIGSTFQANTVFLPFAFDVKEMFTGLPHFVIRNAVLFLIDYARELTRSQYVRVPNDKSYPCAFGRSANKFDVAEITFSQIFEIVSFDIRSAVFTLGSHLFLQQSGAPIGILSTAEAIATCVHAEHVWHSSLGVDAMFIRVLRYVDDLIGVAVFNDKNAASQLRAQTLVRQLQTTCYPDGLVLQQEQFHNQSVVFLEANVHVSRNKITVSHHSKNIQHIRDTGSQKFYTMQCSNSFSSRNSKRGVLISRLIAISSNSPCSTSLLSAVKNLFHETSTLGYGNRIQRQACARMYRVSHNDIWLTISQSLLHKPRRSRRLSQMRSS